MKKFITLCSVVLLAVPAVTLSAQKRERIDENNAGKSDSSLTAFEPPALIVRKGDGCCFRGCRLVAVVS